MVHGYSFCRCNNILYIRGVDDEGEDGEMKEWSQLDQLDDKFVVRFCYRPDSFFRFIVPAKQIKKQKRNRKLELD